MNLPDDCRYSPLKHIGVGGVIMVRDKRADQPVEFVQLEKSKNFQPNFLRNFTFSYFSAGGVRAEEEEKEPEPPQPFEFRE